MNPVFKKIAVIGLGYIGLPTAALFASRKINVAGIDINEEAVNIINAGKIHIIEPELDILVHAVVSEGYLKASCTPESADAFIIAVPTPFKEGHQPDLSYIQSAAYAIAPVLKVGDLVILESTSPVGATEKLAEWLAEKRSDLTFPQEKGTGSDIRVAYCPERVLPGHVLHELVNNDRIIGGMTTVCSEAAVSLYKIFVEGECIITNTRTAEMCKLTENSFRDVNIAFANELSIICDKLDINVWELIRLANRHPRVNILQPGPGVGGHCIAVDPWFIVDSCPEHAKLIRTAREVNDFKPVWVIEKVNETIERILSDYPQKKQKDITIVCLGLAFKADIDDLRESPALDIVKKLSENHTGPLLIIEPNIRQLPAILKNKADLSDNTKAFDEADIIIVLVDHKQFKLENRDFKYIVDTRGIFSYS